jgi:hypothetical protein
MVKFGFFLLGCGAGAVVAIAVLLAAARRALARGMNW